MEKNYQTTISGIVFLLIALLVLINPVMAAGTTQVHIVKYADDGKTVLHETTVDFHYMETNLPVYGDGATHYYMQGPVFNASITDKWNPEENDPAILTKDFGAVKGTNIKDLCDLVGGMSSSDKNVTLLASDGFSKTFAYSSIYNPPARAGPMVLTWYRADQGYVDSSYTTGMRNVMFADTTTNPWGDHVFGLWDMHETYPEAFWYYYQPGQPSATGLSVQTVDRIFIYSSDPVPPDTGSISVTSNPTGAEIFINSVDIGLTTPQTFANKVVGNYDVYVTKAGYVTPATVTKAVTKSATTSFDFTLSLVPPDTGSISITSNPTGAEIFINSIDTGLMTPQTFTDKVVGNYDVYVTKSGYVTPATQTKAVTKGATTSFDFTLSLVPPDTGSISVTSNPTGAEIFINSVDTGLTTPQTFANKVVGNYDVYVTKAGYVTPSTVTKAVTKGATTSFDFTLSLVPPDTGSISVTSNPTGTEIFINSVDTGLTTPQTFANKVVGNYDVYVTKAGYVTPTTVTKAVTKGATTSFDFTLSLVPPDTGSISVTSNPAGAEIFINSVDTGLTTPQTFANKVVGNYDVYVTKAGYVTPTTVTKAVTKGATTSFDFTLSLVPPDTGSISVTSNPTGAEIFINSVDTGLTTPQTFANKVVGNYDVYVTKAGYVTPSTVTKAVTKGATTSFDFTLSLVPPDTLYDGTVTLVSDTKFTQVPYNNPGSSYQVNTTTPLGALASVNKSQGIPVDVTDKSYSTKNVLMVDNIGNYLYSKSAGYTWICQLNGVTLDDFGANATDGLNVRSLVTGDQVNFYYGVKPVTPASATAIVKIKVNIPAPDTGSISVTSNPTGAEIFINSVDTGLVTPQTFTNKVVGNYDVYVTKSGYVTPATVTKAVTKGATTTYDFTLSLVPPDTGSITVTSTPDAAEIFINSADTGVTTPHTFTDKVVGNYDVYVTKAGYVTPVTVTKAVTTGATTTYDFTLSAVPPVLDTLYDGTVTLNSGETFTKQAYNNVTGGLYTINRTTPLGALDKVATLQGFTYNVTDKRWSYDQALMLDDVSHYLRKNPGYWYAYVNGVYKDSYGNHANGLDVIELKNNDQVNFFYSTGDNVTAPTDAIAAVKIKVNIPPPAPVMDILFDGTVTLNSGETFTKQAYNNVTGGWYTINRTTPLGALDKVASLQGFTYNVTDKRWQYDQALMLDDVSHYLRKSPGNWYAYVNGVYKDSYGNHANGLNVIELSNNDQVNFFYSTGDNVTAPTDALAAVKIKVNTGSEPAVPDWTLTVNGAKTQTVSKTLFEQGLACPSSGHQVFWTDTDGNTWGGVPLWLLVGMVDDNPDVGPDHYNFNDSIAAQGYSVKVSSGDGWDTTLASKDIARNNSYIVANTINGQPLPRNLTNGKLSWPLHLKGAAVFGGQQVGNITKIELTGLPQPPTEWTLSLQGDVTDTITQSYFMDAIACHHNVTWTDTSTGTTWEGVALWDLVGAVDDIETTNHFTFNDTRATKGYTVRVTAADGFNAAFASAAVAHNNSYIVAYKMNGVQLTGTSAPLKLVGPATTSNKERVGGIIKISLEGLPDQYPAGNWQLKLNGKIGDVIPQGEFEDSVLTHNATYTDATTGNVYKGIPLWRLMGWVDDRIPHGPDGFNDAAAIAGYKVIVKAGDGYAKEFTSQQIGKSDAFIVANTMNGAPLPTDGSKPPYPLRLVGSGATGGSSVGNVVEIQLTDFQTPVEAPKLHIIKYGSDGTTIINETYVDYTYMEARMPVIGDGTTVYKFEGLTLNASNLWDPEETYPGGYKISNAVKGTRVHDLAELVGGMGSGTTVTFVASDGFETTLPYSSIYTNPAVQARQGDAIIAWWGDGEYVPKYPDGMRLFFTPGGDHVYGHWDMHETLPSQYWRYNFQNGVQYPSAAGLSAKYITTIKVYSSPESDWTLELDGRDIGGINYTVSKPFLEEALACTQGAEHKATYTDSSGRVWEGMPLWFMVGFVDDADQHSSNAYNDSLALKGYQVIVTGADGSSTVLDSIAIMKNSNYIIANSLNGVHIDESNENWPLRLTGVNISESQAVKGVKSIRLVHTLVAPDASFTADPLTGTAPLSVAFKDSSNGESITKWVYDFGDGSSSSEKNPTHVYTAAGTYKASLTVTNSAGSSTAYVTVSVMSKIPVADFTATPISGSMPLTVKFTDASTGATSWAWKFGDGSTSSEKNPGHTYSRVGTYTVNLTVKNAAGSASKELKITVKMPLPVADFTVNPTSGQVPLIVKFMDTSSGASSRSWAFGDGATSTEKNPTHKYTKAGVYTATLTVTNSGGSVSKQVTITVNGPTLKKPEARFTQNKYTGKVPLTVQFTDRSINSPDTYLWRFGDGSTSTEMKPSHVYTRAGIYTPTLTVTNSAGSDTARSFVIVLPKWFWG